MTHRLGEALTGNVHEAPRESGLSFDITIRIMLVQLQSLEAGYSHDHYTECRTLVMNQGAVIE